MNYTSRKLLSKKENKKLEKFGVTVSMRAQAPKFYPSFFYTRSANVNTMEINNNLIFLGKWL